MQRHACDLDGERNCKSRDGRQIKDLRCFKRHGWPRPRLGLGHKMPRRAHSLCCQINRFSRGEDKASVRPEVRRKYGQRPSLHTNTWSKHSLDTHARFDVRCMWVSLCFRSFVVIDSCWCCVIGFACYAFAFSGVLLHKVLGSYVHVCPRPCLSTCRWARLATHRHNGPPAECVLRALMPAVAPSPPHVCHRQGIGLSSMQQDVAISLAASRILAHFLLLFGLFNAEVRIQKIGNY